jgi:hypothetical protein
MTTAPTVREGSVEVIVPGVEAVKVPEAISVQFANGQRLVMDTALARIRDWTTDNGVHLVSPLPYGNPIDLTSMDDWGAYKAEAPTPRRPWLAPQITLDYFDRVDERHVWWLGYSVMEDGVTFQYRIPLCGPGIPRDAVHDLWIWATVWETWRPCTRQLASTIYKGLSRKIEIDVPSFYRDGYSLCLNDGFGMNGSSDHAVTYELRWENPFLLETHWEKGRENKGLGTPRTAEGFQGFPRNTTQVLPFIFARFPKGTLLLAPRHYYYATSYCLTNYAAQGHDGLWPNYAIDTTAAGSRSRIETFEYLWTADTSLAPPQQYIDASFYYRRRLGRLYGLNPYLATISYAWDYWGPPKEALAGKTEAETLEVLKEWGATTAERARDLNADYVGGAHELWTSQPYAVNSDIRLNPDHPINRAIREMVAEFSKRGIGFGYWTRTELAMTCVVNVLSDHFSTRYYGYAAELFPPLFPAIEQGGLPLLRQHPEWIRTTRSGAYPTNPIYHATPMSMGTGWYDEVVFKSFVMMKTLGYSAVFQDGGQSVFLGVDYTGGRARAIQPYWWRVYQDLAHLGLEISGECLLGWGNNTLATPTEGDMRTLWAYAHSIYRGNNEAPNLQWFTPELRHRSYQLYEGVYLNLKSSPEHGTVARFAQDFLRRHGPPDRVYLENLRWDDRAQEYKWSNVWWEYGDGRRIRYPNYNEISHQ